LENCLAGIAACARQWVDASNSAKGVRPGTTKEAENWLTGPVAVARCLRLMMVAGNEKERRRQLNLPNGPYLAAGSQLHVPLFPGRGLYDSLLFRGFGAEARLLPGVSLGELHNPPVRTQSQGVCLVLGAGNVSAIPLTD